jgi:hypothetical protein
LSHNDSYKPYLKISEVYKDDTLISDHVFIYYKNTPLVILFHSNVCYGYNIYNEMRIASIHTIIFMYLCILLTPYKHFHNKDSLECLVNILALKQSKLRSTQKKLFQDVVSQCYGENIGLVTLRKNRLLRLAKQN